MTKPNSWALCTTKFVFEKYPRKFENIFGVKVIGGAKIGKSENKPPYNFHPPKNFKFPRVLF